MTTGCVFPLRLVRSLERPVGQTRNIAIVSMIPIHAKRTGIGTDVRAFRYHFEPEIVFRTNVFRARQNSSLPFEAPEWKEKAVALPVFALATLVFSLASNCLSNAAVSSCRGAACVESAFISLECCS